MKAIQTQRLAHVAKERLHQKVFGGTAMEEERRNYFRAAAADFEAGFGRDYSGHPLNPERKTA